MPPKRKKTIVSEEVRKRPSAAAGIPLPTVNFLRTKPKARVWTLLAAQIEAHWKDCGLDPATLILTNRPAIPGLIECDISSSESGVPTKAQKTKGKTATKKAPKAALTLEFQGTFTQEELVADDDSLSDLDSVDAVTLDPSRWEMERVRALFPVVADVYVCFYQPQDEQDIIYVLLMSHREQYLATLFSVNLTRVPRRIALPMGSEDSPATPGEMSPFAFPESSFCGPDRHIYFWMEDEYDADMFRYFKVPLGRYEQAWLDVFPAVEMH